MEVVAACPSIFMGLALVHFQKYWLLNGLILAMLSNCRVHSPKGCRQKPQESFRLSRAGRAVLSEVMVGSCRLSGEFSVQKKIKVVEMVRYLEK